VEFLHLPALLMGAVTGMRNRLYDRGWLPAHRLQMPVISVGNLTVGGTGKTPMVVLLVRELMQRGFRPGVLSRGYRAGTGMLNDEGKLFAELLPGVPQVQRPDRVAGARELERLGADAIVLDDGFQHRRLARDLDLVLIDATRPWGLPPDAHGHPAVRAILPRGLLREAPSSLARASVMVITRSDAVEPVQLERLEAELETHVPGTPCLCAVHRPSGLRRGTDRLELDVLRGRPVVLVSGIGNPQAFERTARDAGADVRAVHAFPDHHTFERAALDELVESQASDERVELLVTAKDAVKLAELGVPHLVLEIELELIRGRKVLEALLDALPHSQAALEREAAHPGLHG
jgi:tetraacyldisaccharide 4'-kinase